MTPKSQCNHFFISFAQMIRAFVRVDCGEVLLGESPIRSGLTPIKAGIMVHAIHRRELGALYEG